MRSPWAVSHSERETGREADYAPQEQSAYAAPGLTEENGYADEFGWGPNIRSSPTGIPDGSRVGTQERRDFRPEPNRPPDDFWQKIDLDRDQRYGASERVDGNGWDETKVYPGYSNPGASVYSRWAANPRATPPPEPRITGSLTPRTYSYERPFDQLNRAFADVVVGSKRTFNGLHFSMADHRREYEILGMAPQRTPGGGSRNTYRLDPAPWDANIVDRAAPTGPVNAILTQQEVPAAPSRSWRLP